jgi:hypothetical protein
MSSASQVPQMVTVDRSGSLQFTISIYGPLRKTIEIPGVIKFTIPVSLCFWDDEIDHVIAKLKEYGITQYKITCSKVDFGFLTPGTNYI